MNLRFTSPGTVVPPREVIADIVPSNPRLLKEAHLRTDDASRVQKGQNADIRFTAYSSRTVPLVQGKVVYVAADRTLDRSTGQAFYIAHVEADSASLNGASEIKLVAGNASRSVHHGSAKDAAGVLSRANHTSFAARGARALIPTMTAA
jgi:multidrug resistance efflux pump